MRYNVVPTGKGYRGIARLLLATDLYTKQTRNQFDSLLDMYYNYLSVIEESPTQTGLRKLVDFCNKLVESNIQCEVIAYDIHPLKTAFDYPLEFLGIDIVHELSESLICECTSKNINQMLNKNGLCDAPMMVHYIVPFLDHGDVNWEPCYVYRVINSSVF